MEQKPIVASELRLDNLVLSDNQIVKIVTIYKFINTVYVHTLDEEVMFEVTICDVCGIPITPEWLERGGFNVDNYTEVDGYVVKAISGKYYFCSDYIGREFKYEILYVHQLQNIYFALTGKELEFGV